MLSVSLSLSLYLSRSISLSLTHTHTAAIFYRVIESMFPAVRQKMLLAATFHHQNAPLAVNFVPEYLTGAICADHYEVHGGNKIGKGSYGSVYRATHK
jgi:hypothetical protein